MTEHVFADNVRELSTSTGTGDFSTTGGSVVIPTAAVGRAIGDVASVGDTFDYVIHHQDSNEWEIGVGTYNGTNTFSRSRVVASSSGGSLVSFTAGTKAVWIGPTSEVVQHFADIENVATLGATAGGSNTAALAAARTRAGVNKPIFSPNGATSVWGVKQSTTGDFGGDSKGEGSLFSASQGTSAAPSTVSNPLIYLEKYTAGGAGSNNDHGCIDARIKKVGGTQYTYGIYAAAENAGGAAGRVAPFAALLNSNSADAVNDVAGVFYAQKSVASSAGVLTGVQIVIADTSAQDNGWQATFAFGNTYGISLEAAVGRSTVGYRLAGSGVAGTGYYTGLLIDTDSVLPDSYDGQSEAIRINGGSTSPKKYNGIKFENGYLGQAINFVGPSYDSSVMILAPKNTYWTFGTSAADNTRFAWNSSDLFTLENGSFGVNGTKVVGARATGWTAPSGTATRTGYTTSTASTEDVAEALKALIDDLVTHGLIGT